ncbi:uncharacterized protein LOC141726712 [Zonotrichia albicollis]|uniref:uncharacterized protein LOC141726712 n=1 Tax=Zonotrichia albicollis TaxID=44394 RepID=UPI003D80B896
MGLSTSRSVEIQVINNTEDFTLRNARTYFLSGHSSMSPQTSVSPCSSSSCKFTNNTIFWGCNGLLAYEADSFTLAIYFSNPMDHNLFAAEMGLELSLDRVHRMDLESAYRRLVKSSQSSSDSSMFPCIILKESQDRAQLSHGPVTVTATMARGKSAIIKVEVEERENSGGEAGIGTVLCRRMHPGEVRNRKPFRRTSCTDPDLQGHPENPEDTPRNH